jgi:hypothetical protein
MDEQLKNDDKKVMLVEVPGEGQLKGITNIDRKGDAKITRDDVSGNNLSRLFDVNTHDSALEAFFKKMVEQAQNPAHTGVANAVSNIYIISKSALDKLLKVGLDTQLLEPYRVDPAAELQKRGLQNPQTQAAGGETAKAQSAGGDTAQSFQPLDPAKIDREDMERKGIRWEAIEPHLKAMTYGHKSHGLVEMSPELEPGGVRVPTKGRVSLAEQVDDSIIVIPHYWQEKPNLDAPLHGVLLPDDVKANLEATRHGGRLVDLELTPGKPEPCFVSIDKHTNTLEALPLSALEQRSAIKKATLSEEDTRKLYGGEKALLEKFTTRDGYFRDGYIQVDASNRNFEWSYDGLDRNRYAQENREIYKQRVAEGKITPREAKRDIPDDGHKTDLTIHKRIKGADVPEKAYKEWSEAVKDPEKRASVNFHYIRDMTDEKGQKFNAWVKPNFEKEKFDFYKYNPKYARSKGAEVTPASESKTQVATNSEGKTNEQSKHSQANGQPLKQGQAKPTDTQKSERQHQRPPARRNPGTGVVFMPASVMKKRMATR